MAKAEAHNLVEPTPNGHRSDDTLLKCEDVLE